MESEQRSDDDLARQVTAGDEEAFAELYGRFFGPLYDFAIRLTRNRDLAAATVQLSLLRTYQGLRAGQVQGPVRLQLFTAIHQDLIGRLRRGRPEVLEGEEAFVAADASQLAHPGLANDLPELARTAWQTAREMRPEEYELLDLNIRQQLDVGEMAAVLQTKQEPVQSRLVQARELAEQSFSSLLLLNRGRQECLDLDFLIGDEPWSSGLQRRVLRHLQSCQTCQTMRRRYPIFTEVLATLTPVAAPSGWQEIILTRLQDAVHARVTVASVAPPPPQQPPGPLSQAGEGGIGGWFRRVFGQGGSRGPLLAGIVGVILVVGIALAALCGAGAFDGDGAVPTITGTATITATATQTFTPTATITATPTATPVPPTAPPPPPTATPVPPPPTATLPPPPPTPTP